ncbi:MAG: hypothetical protein LBK13_12520 [Spirochaetales bacterium]|jgi:hypothetical protein|nr:hypothetical protein [Spirochaetales bacterium]
MKKRVCLFIFFVALVFPLCAEPSFVGKRSKIILLNSTGYEVTEVYVSPASSDDWGDDYLVNTTLDNGDSFSVTLPVPLSEADVYDIQFVDIDGDTYTLFDVPVRNGGTVEVTDEDLDEYDDEVSGSISE